MHRTKINFSIWFRKVIENYVSTKRETKSKISKEETAIPKRVKRRDITGWIAGCMLDNRSSLCMNV